MGPGAVQAPHRGRLDDGTGRHTAKRTARSVGTHGAHVTLGLIWFIYIVAQVAVKGFRPHVLRRHLCFSLFWHALDIVWVGVFTLVYLMGAR